MLPARKGCIQGGLPAAAGAPPAMNNVLNTPLGVMPPASEVNCSFDVARAPVGVIPPARTFPASFASAPEGVIPPVRIFCAYARSAPLGVIAPATLDTKVLTEVSTPEE